MAIGHGYKAFIGFGEEVTYGLGVASTKYVEIQEESLKLEHSRLSKPSLRRVSLEHTVMSLKSVTGGFSFQLPFTGVERIFKHALGQSVTTGSSPFTHTATLTDALPTGLSVTVDRDTAAIGGTSAYRYEGCRINTLTIRGAVEEFVMVEAEVIGEDQVLVAAETPTFPTFVGVDYAMMSDASWQTAPSVFLSKLREFEVTLNNNLVARPRLGNRLTAQPVRSGPREITGSMTMEFDSITAEEITRYNGLTADGLKFEFLSGSNQFTIDLPKVFLHAGNPVVGGPDVILLPLEFRAYMNAVENDEFKITTINSTGTI